MCPSSDGYSPCKLGGPSRRAVVKLAMEVEAIKSARRAAFRERVAVIIGVIWIVGLTVALVFTFTEGP